MRQKYKSVQNPVLLPLLVNFNIVLCNGEELNYQQSARLREVDFHFSPMYSLPYSMARVYGCKKANEESLQKNSKYSNILSSNAHRKVESTYVNPGVYWLRL